MGSDGVFGGILLLRPWWFALLPAVLLFGLWRARQSSGLAGWDGVIDPHLRRVLTSLGRITPGRANGSLILSGLVAAILAVALVGFAVRDRSAPAFRNLDTLVLALDLSPSILQGGSLDDVQAAAALLTQRAGGRPVALVLFAHEAYLASAPTVDPQTTESLIAVLDADTMPDTGSDPAKALELARSLLANGQVEAGDVVLITDGGGLPSAQVRTEVAGITALGGRVSTVFVAPKIPPQGAPRPDPEAARAVAKAGQGESVTSGDVLALADDLGRRASGSLSRQDDMIALLYTDYGRYLIVLALVPALLLFRRRG
ncbi:vWA domain-containing protein [Rhodospirillum sp. A1_3_36]|uniref:vWA domain-containing protein n=1 Tax=Rhodospirillum sp. A1_3_36 TaxID=3391666 RepID=UPI0039A74378